MRECSLAFSLAIFIYLSLSLTLSLSLSISLSISLHLSLSLFLLTLAGPHGAGLSNFVACEGNATLVEFAIAPYNNPAYCHMAWALGKDYLLETRVSGVFCFFLAGSRAEMKNSGRGQ
jgi:hypothetical protein